MDEVNEKQGSDMFSQEAEKDFDSISKIEMLTAATGGLSLSQVCAVTGLEGTTIQNWVKRGWVAHPKNKKYEEVHVARILIINALKDCIKLEHITHLMSYVNNQVQGDKAEIIKESRLFAFLTEALEMVGKVEDLSSLGIETVVKKILKNYNAPSPQDHDRVRRALTVMIYACVSTDIKRRTESMMEFILRDKKGAQPQAPAKKNVVRTQSKPKTDIASKNEPKKTIIQALREWDQNSQIAASEESKKIDKQPTFSEMIQEKTESKQAANEKANPSSVKPVYFRRG